MLQALFRFRPLVKDLDAALPGPIDVISENYPIVILAILVIIAVIVVLASRKRRRK